MQTILRELGESFTFDKFTERLEESKRNFNPAQLAGLEQRMSLLKSFLEPVSLRYGLPRSTKPKRFCAGQLTIVDLSDPFLDVASACGLFEIIVRLFVRDDLHTGKVILVDEAHKVSMLTYRFIHLVNAYGLISHKVPLVPKVGKWPHQGPLELDTSTTPSCDACNYQHAR